MALECLGLSPAEHQTLYLNPISATELHKMYGFLTDMINGVDWKSIVVRVPEFLKRTGLQYCEFLELWKPKFVEFERRIPDQFNAAGGPTGLPQDPDFPICEPCCPDISSFGSLIRSRSKTRFAG